MAKKESPETATQTKSVTATGISDDYITKISKLKEIYNSRASKRTRGFITDASRALNLEQHEASNYGTFATPLGDVSLRISTHNASVEHFDSRGEKEGVSIVITSNKNKGVKRGGDAHVIEFFYPRLSLEKSSDRPLVKIIESIMNLSRRVYGCVFDISTMHFIVLRSSKRLFLGLDGLILKFSDEKRCKFCEKRKSLYICTLEKVKLV